MRVSIKHSRFLVGTMFAALLILGACSTKKDTFVHRTFHTTNTRFNYYYNADISYRDGMKQLAGKNVDDFNNLLRVFPVGTENDANAVLSQMDRAIQKLAVAILKHGMFISGQEKNAWLDESYMLMGKAQLFKRDYISAKTTFDFVNSRFGKQPAAYDAMLWKARLLVMTGDYSGAAPLLGIVGTAVKKNKTWRRTNRLFPLVYADLLLQENNLEASIPYLQKGIKENYSKKIRIRLTYILAQVYHELGRYEEASKTYSKVMRLNPPYTFAFNARISMARCYESETSGNSKSMLKLLEKMLKDEKNKEYLDQVYFALAEVSLKSLDTSAAVNYLQKSASSSMQNRNQKALSCLMLADLLFIRPDYVNAAAYYDSTIQFLSKEFPGYTSIERKTKTLSELVKNLLVVETQDSLQRIAKMPENERNQLVDGFIKKIMEEEAAKRQAEIERQQSIQFFEQESRNMQSVTQTTVGFYFYSPQALSLGFTEFQKRWGNRPNEDLWRLSSRQGLAFGNSPTNGQDSAAVDSLQAKKGNPKDRNYYLADVPLTPEKMEASHRKIAQALYNAGSIYRTGLNDPDQAIETFLLLEKRYPESELIVQSWFQLYHIYSELEFVELAQRYKQKIIEKYPDTDYARLLNDPEYYAKLQAEKSEGETFYKSTYEAFIAGKADVVTRNRAIAFAKYHDKDLLGRFEYLKTLTLIKSQPADSLKPTLERFLQEYDGTKAGDHAKGVLALMDERAKPAGQVDSLEASSRMQGIFEFDGKAPHLLLFVLDGNAVNINESKILVSDHNRTSHSLKKLSTSSVLLDQNRQIITVSSFQDAKEALDYLKTVDANPKLKETVSKGKGEVFVISAANYAKFYKRKNVAEYLSFFKEFYKDQ